MLPEFTKNDKMNKKLFVVYNAQGCIKETKGDHFG